jgi:hypothetical protein
MSLRDLEAESLRAFVQSAADEGYLSGRVLDLGCGKQPYRAIVEAAGGIYYGHDSPNYPASVVSDYVLDSPENWWEDRWDTILSTQVVQYIPIRDEIDGEECSPLFTDLWMMCDCLSVSSGHLVLTYPTTWPEVEPEDLHRFTKAGMERLLTEAGFEIICHEWRAGFQYDGVSFALGYGVICRA